MLSRICRLLGVVFCDFSVNLSQNAFQTYMCGLILGPCFCCNPFLWRAIDFGFLLGRFRYFLWILEFLLFLLLCFSTSLLFCLFALLFFLLLCFSASLLVCFSCFSVILFLLLFCFSAFLASLFCFPAFFLFVFPASLLLCFSAFLFLPAAVIRFHDISNKSIRAKIRKPFPYFVLPLVEFELCKHLK